MSTYLQNIGLQARLTKPRLIAHDNKGRRLMQTGLSTKGPIGYSEDVRGRRTDELLLDSVSRWLMDVQWEIDDEPLLLNTDGSIPDSARTLIEASAGGTITQAEADFAQLLREIETMSPEDQAAMRPAVDAARKAIEEAKR